MAVVHVVHNNANNGIKCKNKHVNTHTHTPTRGKNKPGSNRQTLETKRRRHTKESWGTARQRDGNNKITTNIQTMNCVRIVNAYAHGQPPVCAYGCVCVCDCFSLKANVKRNSIRFAFFPLLSLTLPCRRPASVMGTEIKAHRIQNKYQKSTM